MTTKCTLKIVEPRRVSINLDIADNFNLRGYLAYCKTGCGNNFCLHWSDYENNEKDFLYCPYCSREIENEK